MTQSFMFLILNITAPPVDRQHKNQSWVFILACSPDSDTNFFNIVTGVLKGDTLAPYFYTLPRLSTVNVNRSNKRIRFHMNKNETGDISQKLCQT